MSEEEIAWIDTANQIKNSWDKKTTVGIFFENKNKVYTLNIGHKYKLKIKNELKEHNEQVIAGNLQAYLVYLCYINLNHEFSNLKRTYLCPDFQPFKAYHKYLQKCFSYHGKKSLFETIKIRCKPAKIRSKAHPKVRKAYRGRKPIDYNVTSTDVKNFISYFIKQNHKKKN